jgi:hypothetical protein
VDTLNSDRDRRLRKVAVGASIALLGAVTPGLASAGELPAQAAVGISIEADGDGLVLRPADRWDHTLTVDGDALVLVPGSGDAPTVVDLTDVDTVRLDSRPGPVDDRLAIDLSGGRLPVAVFFHGGDGVDELLGPTTDTTWHVDGEGSGRVAGVGFESVEALIGAADNEDTFTFHQDGSLAGLIDGGQGGFDSLVMTGTYGSIVHAPTAPDAGTVTLDGVVITYVGLEPLTNTGTAADFVFDLTAVDDAATLRPFSPGRLEIAGATFEDTNFAVPTSTLTINGGAGVDAVTLTGIIDLGSSSLTVVAEGIVVEAGSSITTTGDVTLAASDSDVGSLPLPALSAPDYLDELVDLADDELGVSVVTATAAASVRVDGATIDAANVALTTASSATPNAASDNFVLVGAQLSATVEVIDSVITADGDVTIDSQAILSANAEAGGDANELNGADGAIGAVVGSTSATSGVSGTSLINAGGALSILSTNNATATGSGRADFGNLGGGVSVVEVDQTTTSSIDVGPGSWSADSVMVRALSDNDVSSAATTSPDGSDRADQGAGADSPDDVTNGLASTVFGSSPISGALASTVHTSTVEAYVQGGATITTTGSQTVEARSTNVTGAAADGSTADNFGTGVADAVAAGNVRSSTDAWLDGGITLVAPGGVRVLAGNVDGRPDDARVDAVSGATAAGGVHYGSLSTLVNDTTRTATVRGGGADVDGDLMIEASSVAGDDVVARSGPAGEGLGPSIGRSIVNEVTSAMVSPAGGVGALVDDLSLAASSERSTQSSATGGSDGGSRVGDQVFSAVAVSNRTTTASLGAGPAVAAAGAVAVLADLTGGVTTTASGDTDGGTGAADGQAQALSFVDHGAEATTQRDVSANGAVDVSAQTVSATNTTGVAGANGVDEGRQHPGGVDGEIAAARADIDALAAAQGVIGSSGAPPPSAATSSEPVAVAASVALSIAGGRATASLPAGVSVQSGGAVSFTSAADIDVAASADAAPVGPAPLLADTVGSALALNQVAVENSATIAGTVDAASLAVEAIMPGVAAHAFGSVATSGPWSEPAGGPAASLALNIADVSTSATVADSASVALAGGDLQLSSRSDASSTAVQTSAPGAVQPDSVGSAEAMNIVEDQASSLIGPGASLDLASSGDVTIAANGVHPVETSSEATTSGNGTIVPSIAVAISNVDRLARIQGSSPLTIGGALDITAAGDDSTSVTTTAGGATGPGPDGLVTMASSYADHETVASTSRTPAAAGGVAITTASDSWTAARGGIRGGFVSRQPFIDVRFATTRAEADAIATDRGMSPSSGTLAWDFRNALTVLAAPCRLYDSTVAVATALQGVFLGGETRTVAVAGPLDALGQGGASDCDVPLGASAALVSISVINPVAAGNLRVSEAGVAPSGGVVNYAANGLNNANTVAVPLSPLGAIDVAANGGQAGAFLPSADVRVAVIGYYAPNTSALRYTPVVPCAAADSRISEGASGPYAGPFAPGAAIPDVDVVGAFSTDQGGNTVGTCGVPSSADAVVVNVVATNPAGGAGSIAVGTGGTEPVEATTPFAGIGVNNAATAVIPVDAAGTLAININGLTGSPTTNTRIVVMGYLDNDTSAGDYSPVNPCAAFDSRSGQGASGSFAGLRDGGAATTYQVAGTALPADQGGGHGGSCGVPDGAAAVLVNLVAIGPAVPGNLRAYATGTTPTGGILNFAPLSPAMNNSNAVVVPLSALGSLDVFVNTGPTDIPDATHVRGVILGYYS